MSNFLQYFINFFTYIYTYLERVKVILDEFSFTDSTIFNDFFGAIRYIVGDTIYMYFYIIIICSLGFMFFNLFKSIWSTFVN